MFVADVSCKLFSRTYTNILQLFPRT